MSDDPPPGEFNSPVDSLRAELSGLKDGIDEIRQWLHNLQSSQDAALNWLNNLSSTITSPPLSGPGTIDLQTWDAGLGGTVMGFRDGRPAVRERIYLDFEGAFRGSEETIRERQRAYLPLLEGHGPVLDVGCGRGELLALLGAAGVVAAGIDSDPGMVAHCHERGLANVRQATAGEFLSAASPGEYGSVVALQVIEHLPYRSLLDFLRAAREALAPGGRLVVETVNPHAPQALRHFWIDPTHQHPLFPEVVLTLLRLSGFAEGFIWYPAGTGDPERDRAEQPDYAVVGTPRR